MLPSRLTHNVPPLEAAIETALVVSPETPISHVVERMCHAGGTACEIACDLLENKIHLAGASSSTCVLIQVGTEIVGIFTERDLVRLATAEVDLASIPVAAQMTTPVITLTQTSSSTLFTALSLMRQQQIRHLPVVSGEGQIRGIVTSDSIRRVLQPFSLLKHRQVEEIMTTDVICAPASTSVFEIAQQMHHHHVSCVIITDASEPIGILTERDLVQFKTLELNLREIPVRQVMSSPLFSIRPSMPLLLAHQEMQQRRIRRLVVTDDQEQLVGILTQTDVLKVFDPTEIYGVVEILHQSVEERTAELQAVLKKQQDLIELKSRFVSMASHDLRNPLSAILLSTNMLERLTQEADLSKATTYLQLIRRASRHMNQLLNDLLLLGQVEAGKLELSPMPLALESFCQELVADLKLGTAAQPEIRFSASGESCLVCLDVKLLRQILTNLLSNAIKYSPTAAFVDLRLTYQPEKVTFEIQDYGIGIPFTEQRQLFESFFRASNVGQIEGTGLGLAIVKRCLALHQGTINFVSQPGIGTTFTVTLPLRSP